MPPWKSNGRAHARDLPRSDARRLSYDLRRDRSPEMQRRRWIVGLSLLGAALGELMALEQTGMVRRLPDLPLGDPDAIDESRHAYRHMATPDALLHVMNLGATAALAATGGSDRARRRPWLPLALLAKTAFDGYLAVRRGQESFEETGRVSTYATLSAVGTFACLALAGVDALTAGRTIGEEGLEYYPKVRDAARDKGRRLVDRGRELKERSAELFDRVPIVGARARDRFEGFRPA